MYYINHITAHVLLWTSYRDRIAAVVFLQPNYHN